MKVNKQPEFAYHLQNEMLEVFKFSQRFKTRKKIEAFVMQCEVMKIEAEMNLLPFVFIRSIKNSYNVISHDIILELMNCDFTLLATLKQLKKNPKRLDYLKKQFIDGRLYNRNFYYFESLAFLSFFIYHYGKENSIAVKYRGWDGSIVIDEDLEKFLI